MNWIPGPEVPGYDGPSVQCSDHVIATKCDGIYLDWTWFDRMPDGTLAQRFGGASIGDAGEEHLRKIISFAMQMHERSPRVG